MPCDCEPSILLDPEVMICRSCGTVVDLLIDLKCRACNPVAFAAHDKLQSPRQLRNAANGPWSDE